MLEADLQTATFLVCILACLIVPRRQIMSNWTMLFASLQHGLQPPTQSVIQTACQHQAAVQQEAPELQLRRQALLKCISPLIIPLVALI